MEKELDFNLNAWQNKDPAPYFFFALFPQTYKMGIKFLLYFKTI